MRGKATGTADSVKITTSSGDTFVFHNSEIRELGSDKKQNTPSEAGHYFHNTELGLLVTNTTDNSNSILNTTGLSFQTINGYKVGHFFQIGAGIGIDVYSRQIFAPVFLSVRGDFTRSGSVRPFYFINYGHGFNLTKNSSDNNWITTSYSPGYTFGIGAGLKVKAGEKTFFYFSLGHHSQKSVIETAYSNTSKVQENLTYNRFAMRFGFGL